MSSGSTPVPGTTSARDGGEGGSETESTREAKSPRKLFRVLWGLILLLTLLLLLRVWVLTPYRIPTASMEPTLRGDRPREGLGGDTVLVNKAAYWFRSPRRWEIVAFHSPDNEAPAPLDVVKRIVGLPGETILIEFDRVHVDGRRLMPPGELSGITYRRLGPYGVEEIRLGEDEYFVLGDNSPYSQDSRYWGPLSRDRIFGRVIAIIAPADRRRWLEPPPGTDSP